MKEGWDQLEYWHSEEWADVNSRLDDLARRGRLLCPRRELLFASLDLVARADVKVVFVGQDPYPNIADATGVAFSIPATDRTFPYTLSEIFMEYQDDLHYPIPSQGDLSPWSTREGVLLWNAIPSTVHGESLAHDHWYTWWPLTEELIKVLSRQGCVFYFIGRIAKEFSQFVDTVQSRFIYTAHPAAGRYGRGKSRRNLFRGSRPFTRCNDLLVSLGKQPVDWRL